MGKPATSRTTNFIADYVDALSQRELVDLQQEILKNFDRYGKPRAGRLRVKDIVAGADENAAATPATPAPPTRRTLSRRC